jgi:solute carrier family 35 (probable UDP-sugar transporter), member A4
MLTPQPRTRGAALAASEVGVVLEPGTHSKRKQNHGDDKQVTQWKTLLLIFGVVLYSTNSIMFVWAKGESSHFHFILSSVVFLSEVVRVLVCCVLVVCSGAWRHLSTSDFFNKTILNYAFPAIAYAVNDQIAFTCLEEMDSATFQTLSSIKIIFTALSCRVFLKHKISEKQWLGLFSLFVSAIFAASASHEHLQATSSMNARHVHYHYSKMKHMLVPVNSVGSSEPFPAVKYIGDDGEALPVTGDSVESALKDHRFFVTSHGIFLIVIYSALSAIIAAYSQRLLQEKTKKAYQSSLGVKFLKISLWGTLFSLIHCLVEVINHRALHPSEAALLNGFNIWTWMLVINQALLGVVLSAVIKESGAVAKLFLLSFAMILSMALAILTLQIYPDINFCLSVISILCSLFLYNDNGSTQNNQQVQDSTETKHLFSIPRRTFLLMTTFIVAVFLFVLSTPLLNTKQHVLEQDHMTTFLHSNISTGKFSGRINEDNNTHVQIRLNHDKSFNLDSISAVPSGYKLRLRYKKLGHDGNEPEIP